MTDRQKPIFRWSFFAIPMASKGAQRPSSKHSCGRAATSYAYREARHDHDDANDTTAREEGRAPCFLEAEPSSAFR